MPLVFDLTQNKQQAEFFQVAMKCKEGILPYRILAYGGGIRGGKTSVVLAILHRLAIQFKGSRWYVVRDTWPNLKETTLVSFKKFFKNSKHINRITESMGSFTVEYANESKIIGRTLNYNNDKELNWMDGMECNGIFLEQTEGLPERAFTKSLERTGSWYIDPQPPGFIFATFNPTHTWSKQKFYDPWKGGTLDPLFYYQNALAKDNPFITKDQWEAWSRLDPIQYARMIEGDWTIAPPKNRFAYNFKEVNHVSDRRLHYQPAHPLYISFDFNNDWMSCTYTQRGPGWIWTIGETRLEKTNSSYDIANEVKKIWITGREVKPLMMITGDASGRFRKTSAAPGMENDYIIIKTILEIPDDRAFPHRKANPTHEKSQVTCNQMLYDHPQLLIDKSCKFLIDDLNLCEMNPDSGELYDHKTINKKMSARLGHMMDSWRYQMDYFHLNPV